jgi:endonuclease/exonuclease/phosphatase family metal-dependent hydrolase
MKRTLKIMTFNLRGSMMEIDGVNYWPNRADLNVCTLKKYAPDIIGFQEFQHGHQSTYQLHLPHYDSIIGLNTIDNSIYGMQNPIYWYRERFQLLDHGGFYLSDTPDEWSYGWDSTFVRSANWVKLYDKFIDRPLFVLNTHLDHIAEYARQQSTKLIIEQIAKLIEEDMTIFITADFNSRAWATEDHGGTIPAGYESDALPAGTVHKLFTEAGYQDTFVLAGNQDMPHINTYHDFIGEDYPPISQRIDWILFKPTPDYPLKVKTCDIIRDHEAPIYPSDHYPVQAVLSIH